MQADESPCGLSIWDPGWGLPSVTVYLWHHLQWHVVTGSPALGTKSPADPPPLTGTTGHCHWTSPVGRSHLQGTTSELSRGKGLKIRSRRGKNIPWTLPELGEKKQHQRPPWQTTINARDFQILVGRKKVKLLLGTGEPRSEKHQSREAPYAEGWHVCHVAMSALLIWVTGEQFL